MGSGIFEKLFSKERGRSSISTPEDSVEVRLQKEEELISSKGMPDWMAKIVFKDQIELIWATE